VAQGGATDSNQIWRNGNARRRGEKTSSGTGWLRILKGGIGKGAADVSRNQGKENWLGGGTSK